MALSTQPYKGARDFYPEDKRIQNYMFTKIRSVVERYGYEEYDAPILEPYEIYAVKSGSDLVNEETYLFEDRGGRKVVIRPEMTPTVSRMVAGRRQELAYPLRWYSIPNLWRYERPQRGRLREHWQLNVDLFGVSGIEAEHEVISIASDIMKSFGAKQSMYEIRINSRKFMQFVFDKYFNLESTQIHGLMKLIDKMRKMDYPQFVSLLDVSLTPSQRDAGLTDKIVKFLKTDSIDNLPEDLRNNESLQNIVSLFELLKVSKINNVKFDPSIMRGFDYYTDIVFEVYDTDPANNRSMFGGGRYDSLVALFGVDSVPTIGFGMGDVILRDFLKTHNLLPEIKTNQELAVVLIGDVYDKAIPVLEKLRKYGVISYVDFSRAKLDKQIKSAVKKGIHFALFFGEKESESEIYTLRNLITGKEENHGLDRIVSIIKDYRHGSEENEEL